MRQVEDDQPLTWNGWNVQKSSSRGNDEAEEDVPLMRPSAPETTDDYVDDGRVPSPNYARKRSPVVGRRRPKQEPANIADENDVAEPAAEQTTLDADFQRGPRVLPLLGSHAAVAKFSRQKDNVLKKILRQAGQLFM